MKNYMGDKEEYEILKKYKHIKNLNKVILDEFIDKVYIGEIDKETNTVYFSLPKESCDYNKGNIKIKREFLFPLYFL